METKDTTPLSAPDWAHTIPIFAAWLRRQGLSEATVHYYVRDIQFFLTWYVEALKERPHGER